MFPFISNVSDSMIHGRGDPDTLRDPLSVSPSQKVMAPTPLKINNNSMNRAVKECFLDHLRGSTVCLTCTVFQDKVISSI